MRRVAEVVGHDVAEIVFHNQENRGQLAHVSSQSFEAVFARSHGGALRGVNSRRNSIDKAGKRETAPDVTDRSQAGEAGPRPPRAVAKAASCPLRRWGRTG